MNDKMKESLEATKRFFDSPEGKKYMKNWNARELRAEKKIDNLHAALGPMTDKQFLTHVKNEITKHDRKWVDGCYKRGIEPYFKKDLSAIFSVAEKHGEKFVSAEPGMFESWARQYKGLTFLLHQGQGCICEIKKGEERLISM